MLMDGGKRGKVGLIGNSTSALSEHARAQVLLCMSFAPPGGDTGVLLAEGGLSLPCELLAILEGQWCAA